MIAVRFNPTAARNEQVVELKPAEGEADNLSWLAQAEKAMGRASNEVRVLLLGGSDRTHFELRVAQSVVRHDRLPSFYSHALLLEGHGKPSALHVPLVPTSLSTTPETNAIETVLLREFASAQHFPNVAVLSFTAPRAAELSRHVEQLRRERLTTDLVTPLAAWFGFLLGTGDGVSPLKRHVAIPSSLFVDEALSRVGVDVVPGLSERAACPEAIWQAVLWWSEVYTHTPVFDEVETKTGPDAARTPRGRYLIRQPHAALHA